MGAGAFWKRRSTRILVTILLIIIVISGSAYAFWNWSKRVVQPIQFNHKKHVAQVECSGCHMYYSEGTRSGLPNEEVCGICHSVAMTDSTEEVKLRKLLDEGRPIVFKKLFHLPDHVYYSHRRHVVLGKLDCSACHGGIADTEVPPTRPLVNITMAYCTVCHERSKVTNDCIACHR